MTLPNLLCQLNELTEEVTLVARKLEASDVFFSLLDRLRFATRKDDTTGESPRVAGRPGR